MEEGNGIDVQADVDVEEFTFSAILDDHDADVSGKDAMVRCIVACG